MNFADIAIKNKTTMLVLTFCTAVGGILAYQTLGRLEDPEFTTLNRIGIQSLSTGTSNVFKA